MIIAKNLKSLYASHKDELIKLLLSDQVKPSTHTHLELITHNGVPFYDSNNKRYYRFGKRLNMSVDRLGEMMHFTQCLAKGLSPAEDDKIDEMIGRALDDGIRNPQKSAAAKIGAALEERKKRKTLTFHSELYFNLLAIQFIREDENPLTYDNEIQMQKVMAFKDGLTAERAHFFFQQPELKRLIDLSMMSPQDVLKSLEESQAERELLSKKLSLIKEYQNTSAPGEKNGKRA